MEKKEVLPYHLFNHLGSHYVININRMQATNVDQQTAQALNMIANKPEMPLSVNLEKILKDLGLISEDGPKSNRKTKKSTPPIFNIAIFLTYNCNLQCVYCYEDGGDYQTNSNMDEKTALQSVDWLIAQSGKIKKLNIIFFGGEPLLKIPLMKTITEYAQQKANEVDKQVVFNITTNATLLNDEVISFFKKHNFNVVISIDGSKEIHDMQRPFSSGKGSYDIILPQIKKLLEVIPQAEGHAVLAEDTDPLLVKNSLKEIGFTNVTTGIMSKSFFNKDEKAGFSKISSNLTRAMEFEAEEWIRYTKDRDVRALADLMKNTYLYDGVLELLHNNKTHHLCAAGLGYVAISCGGDVYPCHRFSGVDEYKLGNIFSSELDRDDFLRSPSTYIDRCGSCFAKYYCAGGCKYMNCIYGDSISQPSEDFCKIMQREFEISAYICCMLDQDDRAFLLEHKIFPPKPCPLDF